MECPKFDKTYFIYNSEKHKYLPTGEFYYDKIIFRDIFHSNYFKKNVWSAKYNKIVTYSNHPNLCLIVIIFTL